MAGRAGVNLPGATSAPLRPPEMNVCRFCKRARPVRFIAVKFVDMGVKFGVRPGIVGVNASHCKDSVECVEKAKELGA